MAASARLTHKAAMRRMLFLDALAIIAGVGGGLGAVVLRKLIEVSREFFVGHLAPALGSLLHSEILALVFLPAIGGLIVGPLVLALAPEAWGEGVPKVIKAVIRHGGRIRARVAAVQAIASSITLGSQGSAGREGPIAQIGASIGSTIGQIAGLNAHEIRLLVASGLSAGIAGTFNAPLGGALFGMEILLRGFGPFDAVPVVLASVVGASTTSLILGPELTVVIPYIPAWRPVELLFYMLHGAVIGLIAVAWVRLFHTVSEFFSKLPVPRPVKPALGGLVAGVFLALFPGYGIGASGYEGVQKALNGFIPAGFMATLGVVKMVATAFTVGSGGSGGVLAPSLYIGSMFGGALGELYARIAPGIVTDRLGYILAGMASLFAGASQAPLCMIVMIPEISRSYTLIPPIMASVGTSFLASWVFMKGSSLYTLGLEKEGIKVRMFTSYILDAVRVGEVMTRRVVTIRHDAPFTLVETMFEENPYGGYPVVNDAGELVGIITRTDVERARKTYTREELAKLRAIDIATKDLVVAYPDETIREALEKMEARDIERLPVVERGNEKKLIGIITLRDIAKAIKLAMEREEAP